jgi:hypothetical protein
MFTLSEVAMWSVEETLQQLKSALPLGWKLTVRVESRYTVAELHDDKGDRCWLSSNPDPKLLYLDGFGWLMVRNHKTTHPIWRPREREVVLRVPNPASNDPDPPDLDPSEVDAVYRTKR